VKNLFSTPTKRVRQDQNNVDFVKSILMWISCYFLLQFFLAIFDVEEYLENAKIDF